MKPKPIKTLPAQKPALALIPAPKSAPALILTLKRTLALIPTLKRALALFLALILISLFGCSKYEDGPWIILGSPKSRLYGEYKVEFFSKNGIDITQQWKDSCDWTFDFHDNPDTREVEDIFYYHGKYFQNGVEHQMYFYSGFWLSNHNKNLELSMLRYQIKPDGADGYDSIGIFPLQIGAIRTFRICRLKPTELWLKYEAEENIYEIKMNEL